MATSFIIRSIDKKDRELLNAFKRDTFTTTDSKALVLLLTDAIQWRNERLAFAEDLAAMRSRHEALLRAIVDVKTANRELDAIIAEAQAPRKEIPTVNRKRDVARS